MARKPTKPKRPGGYAQLKAAGKTAVMLGLTAEDVALIDRAREIDSRTRAGFITHYALLAAKNILEKSSK